MIKILLTTTLLLAIGGMAHAQARDTSPSTPGNPVARAYGPTSGGIAWQRSSDDRGVRGYEITRDGTVLGVRDTLSYVADDLQPGSGYNFAIVAIDSAGQRSGRALARIETPDARPDIPAGLTANVYSATSAGIKWNRSGVFGERYEVKRDGLVVVAATNATSYVDRSLSNRRPYLYEVIAINRQGQRSTAARLFVRTTDGSTAPPTAGLAAPAGLRSVVYSATAGAVAWDRSATAGLRYEISRDRSVLATTDGTSYVDSALASGQTYNYDVVAIDRTGRRSAASQVTLTTTGTTTPPPVPPSDNPFAEADPEGTSTIARLGYAGLPEALDDLVSAAYLEYYFDIDTAVSNLGVGVDNVERVVSCPGGGTARGTGIDGRTLELEFDGCVIDGRTLSGGLVRGLSGSPIAIGQVLTLELTFDALRIDAGDEGELTVTGSFLRSNGFGQSQACNGYNLLSDAVEITSARIARGGNDVTDITEASYFQSDDTEDGILTTIDELPCSTRDTLTFEGTAKVASVRFGLQAATISTSGELVSDSEDGESRTAVLAADFSDDSSIAITATSTTSNEVQVDILSNGAAVSFSETFAFEAYPFPVTLD